MFAPLTADSGSYPPSPTNNICESKEDDHLHISPQSQLHPPKHNALTSQEYKQEAKTPLCVPQASSPLRSLPLDEVWSRGQHDTHRQTKKKISLADSNHILNEGAGA